MFQWDEKQAHSKYVEWSMILNYFTINSYKNSNPYGIGIFIGDDHVLEGKFKDGWLLDGEGKLLFYDKIENEIMVQSVVVENNKYKSTEEIK